MFDVGDKVTIRSAYAFAINQYAGTNAVIKEVRKYKNTGEYYYRLVLESGEHIPYDWTDSMLVRREA